MPETVCPTCNSPLKKSPQRKTKCPSCGTDIHVKIAPGEKVKRLMTAEQAQEIDAQWEAIRGRDEQLRTLQAFGIDAHQYDRTKAMLGNHGFADGPDSLDWKMGYFLLNEIAAKADDLHQRKMAYDQLALMCMKQGLAFRDYLVRAREVELLQYKAAAGSIVGVEIRNGAQHGVCQACQKNAGKRFSLDEAAQETPLPCEACTCSGPLETAGFCRCYYRTILRGET